MVNRQKKRTPRWRASWPSCLRNPLRPPLDPALPPPGSPPNTSRQAVTQVICCPHWLPYVPRSRLQIHPCLPTLPSPPLPPLPSPNSPPITVLICHESTCSPGTPRPVAQISPFPPLPPSPPSPPTRSDTPLPDKPLPKLCGNWHCIYEAAVLHLSTICDHEEASLRLPYFTLAQLRPRSSIMSLDFLT